jgi:endonuclease/exonuclease/phosphatase family metal-dependent hydrolase
LTRQRRPRVLALVVACLTLAVADVTTAGHSQGSSTCADVAPWILADSTGGPDELHADRAEPLDVATYNLHSGLGGGFALFRSRTTVEGNLRAIARAIAGAAREGGAPDVVGLNEVDFGSRRSGWVDEARFVADELGALTGVSYEVVRGETWRRDVPGFEVRFGNAALVSLPIVESATCAFDDLDRCGLRAPVDGPPPVRRDGLLGRLLREPRGVIRVTVRAGDEPVDVLVTHLEAFAVREREAQAAVLASRFVAPERTTVLLGDMNAVPSVLTRRRWLFSDDRTHAILATGGLADASLSLASRRRQQSLASWATFPAGAPVWGLDWVLGSLDLAPEDATVIGESASDHRGLYVRYRRLRDDREITAARARHARGCAQLRAVGGAGGAGAS